MNLHSKIIHDNQNLLTYAQMYIIRCTDKMYYNGIVVIKKELLVGAREVT